MSKHNIFWTGIILLAVSLLCCRALSPENTAKKINGVSFVGPSSPINEAAALKVNEVNAGWVCLMPFAYSPVNEDTLIYKYGRQWWGEGQEGITSCINLFKKQGKKVMVKPQIWIGHGTFTGELSLSSEQAWDKWAKDYEAYVLTYAEIAEQNQAEIFCIGTELKSFVSKRQNFWTNLITKIKTIYKGKITYAANWDNYQNIPFWEELDYIGVDAYFPLEVQTDAGTSEVVEAWQAHKQELLKFATRSSKQLLFTEVGYRSAENAMQTPWKSGGQDKVDYSHQATAYEGLFQSFWSEPQFAGMFFWKWFDYHDNLEGLRYQNGFTPQKKPAQEIIAKYYGKP